MCSGFGRSGFGRRLNSWHVKACHLAPPGDLFEFEPFHYLFHSLSSHSLSRFFATHNLPFSTQNKDDWPRRCPPPYHSLQAHQPGCSRLSPQPPPYLLPPKQPKQDEFFSFPFFHFNLNRYRTMTCPSHTCRPLRCSHPTCLVHADHSPVLATHALRAATPTTTLLH